MIHQRGQLKEKRQGSRHKGEEKQWGEAYFPLPLAALREKRDGLVKQQIQSAYRAI